MLITDRSSRRYFSRGSGRQRRADFNSRQEGSIIAAQKGTYHGNRYQTNRKQIHGRVLEQGKLELIRELVSDNCRIHDPVFPSLTSGADNLKRHIEMCKNGFPDIKFSIDDTIAERNEVVLHWTARGTHKAQFLGMQPTNRNATVSGTSIFRIDGDKIAEQWTDWNLMSLMEQLGVATAPLVEGQARASSGEPARASSSEQSRA